MSNKERVLRDTIICLERLINNIGETTTEYHWREFAGLSVELIGAFPEYELDQILQEYYEDMRDELKENNGAEEEF